MKVCEGQSYFFKIWAAYTPEFLCAHLGCMGRCMCLHQRFEPRDCYYHINQYLLLCLLITSTLMKQDSQNGYGGKIYLKCIFTHSTFVHFYRRPRSAANAKIRYWVGSSGGFEVYHQLYLRVSIILIDCSYHSCLYLKNINIHKKTQAKPQNAHTYNMHFKKTCCYYALYSAWTH